MNKNIQEFTINDGPSLQPAVLKNKNSVPVHAQMVNDAEGLQDDMKALLKDVKLLNEDAIQVSKNVYDGEQALIKAKKALNLVLRQRKLVLLKGEITKEPDPEGDLDADLDLNNIQLDLREPGPLEPFVRKFG